VPRGIIVDGVAAILFFFFSAQNYGLMRKEKTYSGGR